MSSVKQHRKQWQHNIKINLGKEQLKNDEKSWVFLNTRN
jgi:hypothetical protein